MTALYETRDSRDARLAPIQRRVGLRGMVALLFAAGALLVSAALSVGTYIIYEDNLQQQRRDAAQQGMFARAAIVKNELSADLDDPSLAYSAIQNLSLTSDVSAFLFVGGTSDLYASNMQVSRDAIPDDLQHTVRSVGAAFATTTIAAPLPRQSEAAEQTTHEVEALVVGTRIGPARPDSYYYYEVVTRADLDHTMESLPETLAIMAATTTVSGALVGWWAARRALAPLNGIARAASNIASGDLSTRLARTDDPELRSIVKSFNAMVDTVNNRIERERRFTADVSHELRSPLTTLTTAVHLLKKRRDELPTPAIKAVDLIDTELVRFSRALSDLLELSRLDAGQAHQDDRLNLDEIISRTLEETGHSARVNVREELVGTAALQVLGDKRQLNRVFVNLLDNADKYAGGATAIEVRRRDDWVIVHVDDSGQGVPPDEQERIFERFVRSGSRRSVPGTGLGLSLVREMVAAHGGTTEYAESPYGGARFTVKLPAATSQKDLANAALDDEGAE